MPSRLVPSPARRIALLTVAPDAVVPLTASPWAVSLCAVLALWLAPCPAAAAGCASPAAIHFAPGASAAEVAGGVPRGDRDCFVLEGRKGQSLAITQPAPVDDNIVFQLYRPPWAIHRTEDVWGFSGSALPGAGETQDASTWSGTLPVSGRYLLVVGTSRGGGAYRLRIEIH